MEDIEIGMSLISKTPHPPYYSVIFSSEQTEDLDGYNETAAIMENLAVTQTGFLGIESVRNEKFGITVSYWESLEAINAWRKNLDHLRAQEIGKEKWYSMYKVRVARVEREYGKTP